MTCSLLTMLACSRGIAAGATQLVFVGTYTGKGSEGIYCFRFDPATGEIGPLGLAARTDNPSFLVAEPRGEFLYAVNEVDTFQGRPTGAVSAFLIERASGGLRPLQQVSSLGGGPAHLSLDKAGRFLLVANYGGGSLAVFPLEKDGRIGPQTGFMQAHGSSLDPKRQAGPHAHCVRVTPDNRLAIVADLGIDKLLVYGFNGRTGTLTADSTKFASLDPGDGPRHVAISPSGRFVYVVNELTSSVTVFACDTRQGTLKRKQTITTLPAGFTGTNTAAGIVVDRQGRFLYVSNRGDDAIVVYGIDGREGRLTRMQRMPCGGKSPRHIALDPTGRWLLCANQRSNIVSLFQVGAADGKLTPTSRSVTLTSPVCVTFVP
jgi:6-phosphogluconolactonase